ncbi:MAG TPA: 4-hydroxy-3-methylbut-2-enyl diphosphate reductase, partial [Thauera sp.]|nr:4-hydroxy-3-methylbut-2-enyl diphosphate reductase [Thauera sp.]
PAYLVDNAAGIDPAWIEGKRRIGVTAGASAPEVLVEEVIARLEALSGGAVRNLDGVPEKVTFPLPKELQDAR